jgi:flagellar motor switch protein FliN
MNEPASESTPEPLPEMAADAASESTAEAVPESPIEATVEAPAESPVDGEPSRPLRSFSEAATNDAGPTDLPEHARRLLKIRLPVHVTLAAQRKSIQEILELGPGSIVKFDKTCDEPLELSVGNQAIARGEAVKVGDKFGLRIGELTAPSTK